MCCCCGTVRAGRRTGFLEGAALCVVLRGRNIDTVSSDGGPDMRCVLTLCGFVKGGYIHTEGEGRLPLFLRPS